MKKVFAQALGGSISHNGDLAAALIHLLACLSVAYFCIVFPKLYLLNMASDKINNTNLAAGIVIGLSIFFLLLGYFFNKPDLYKDTKDHNTVYCTFD